MLENVRLNLEENRIVVIKAVLAAVDSGARRSTV
jgi:hypothetical protein